MTSAAQSGAINVFLIACEESGDRLGAALMRALSDRCGGNVRFAGVGGREMAALGLKSLFPIDDLAIIAFAAIPRRLPLILRRLREAARGVLAANPDVLVIIDSPDFTHRVARRVRANDPSIPIIDYVSPSVWAWRPRRARAMRRYVDQLLSILPFEPQVHAKLGGPPCTYVGHPLIERISDLRPNEADRRRRDADPPVLLLLPGSRRSEIDRMFGTFAAAVRLVQQRYPALELVLPTVPSLVTRLQQATADWPMLPRIVASDADKYAVFRSARAALAASGTVTLELALAGVPTVAGYRIGAIDAAIVRALVRSRPLSVILTNLVLGARVVPEFLQEECTSQALATALMPLLGDTPERRAQLDAFARLDAIMGLGLSPSGKAAEAVLTTVTRARAGRLPNPEDMLSTAAGGPHA